MLAESLAKNKSLQKVDLSFNSITNQGTIPIVKALQQNTSIQQVLLFHNPLDNTAMNSVSDALKSDMRGKMGGGSLPEDKRAIEGLTKVRLRSVFYLSLRIVCCDFFFPSKTHVM